MAFHKQLSHEMAMSHFAGQHLGQNQGVLRSIVSDNPSSSAAESDEAKEIQRLPPQWLNSAILRQPNQHHYGDGSFLHLQTNSDSSNSPAARAGGAASQWLPRQPMLRQSAGEEEALMSPGSGELGNGGSEGEVEGSRGGGVEGEGTWQNARYKSEILSHPLYEQLLSAHVACLRIATPVDQLPRIDAQLAQSQQVVSKYPQILVGENKELDQFMAQYVFLLCSFKDQLQQHVRVHALDAVRACWELEQSLQSLTGVSPSEGTGATMSDDEDDQVDSEVNVYDGNFDGPDNMGFGPLVPTESERTLMERVRQELKHELKQGYKEKIIDIREEILRKRRAGKLPGDTTSVLKAWWQSHSKWPYPTEDDKARLVQETGLQLKQINNWFINQRKRNWHSNPSSSSSVKSKRKSNAGDSGGERFM